MSKHVDQHILIAELVRVAQELGRTPSRDQFVELSELKNIQFHIKVLFDNYSVFVTAAGLDPVRKLKKIDNSIFEVKDIDHFLSHRDVPPDPIKASVQVPTMAIISDIHYPFNNPLVEDKFIAYCAEEKPEVIILNGDAWDMYSHAKFPRSHNVFTPREEERKARELNENLWLKLQKASPKSKCYQLLGNHDIRPIKRVMELYPEAEDWIKERLKNMFTFENVETIFDPRQELIFGNIAIHHGYKSKLGDHRDFMLMNSINGHSHSGGVVFRHIRNETLWELNSGYAGDPKAKGLTYTPQSITKWTPGFGAVDRRGPRFIPC